jgi:hypothetical protein
MRGAASKSVTHAQVSDDRIERDLCLGAPGERADGRLRLGCEGARRAHRNVRNREAREPVFGECVREASIENRLPDSARLGAGRAAQSAGLECRVCDPRVTERRSRDSDAEVRPEFRLRSEEEVFEEQRGAPLLDGADRAEPRERSRAAQIEFGWNAEFEFRCDMVGHEVAGGETDRIGARDSRARVRERDVDRTPSDRRQLQRAATVLRRQVKPAGGDEKASCRLSMACTGQRRDHCTCSNKSSCFQFALLREAHFLRMASG